MVRGVSTPYKAYSSSASTPLKPSPRSKAKTVQTAEQTQEVANIEVSAAEVQADVQRVRRPDSRVMLGAKPKVAAQL